MNNIENYDFTIEVLELEEPRMDNSKVQSGCWGDSGSDYANLC